MPDGTAAGQRRAGLALCHTLLRQGEPLSAPDVSIRAHVLNLRVDLQQAIGVACVFMSHDLGLVRHVADEAMVMYLGKVVQHGPRESIFGYPHSTPTPWRGCWPRPR